jgi:hypothetical protein
VAIEGDTPSANVILKNHDKRISILGLDEVAAQNQFPRTVGAGPVDLVRWGMEATREATAE